MKIRGKKVGVSSFLALFLVAFQFQIFINPMLYSSNVRFNIYAHASASSSKTISIKPLTKQDNYSRWQKYCNNSTQNPYLEQPSIVNPYYIGKLNPSFIQGFLNITNFARYLSGLPDDIETSSIENTSAQYGALISAAYDSPANNPPKLNGMDDAFYNNALDAVRNGITLQSGLKSNHMDYMKMLLDETFSNSLLSVHHRRAILNPLMKYTGFGVADKSPRRYIVMKKSDKSRAAFDYDAYAWPNSGYFPYEMFSSEAPWMISLNPAKYDSTKTSNIKVTVIRKNDGQTVAMDSSTKDISSHFFNVITNTKKTEFCIIFRPLIYCDCDEEYNIRITGVYTMDSTPVEINYNVNLYSLMRPIDASPSVTPSVSNSPLNTSPIPSPSKDAVFGYISPDFVNNQTLASDLKKGFTVQIKGSPKYSTTDKYGYFELPDVPSNLGNYTLVIKKQGFLTREVVISDAKQISSIHSPLYLWAGDTGDDDCINMADVLKVASRFNNSNTCTTYIPICDVNQDNIIDMRDVLLIASHFNCTSDDYDKFYR